MPTVTFSRTDLTRKTREILERVKRGQPALIESYGEEQAVLLDPLDYRLLQALAGLMLGHDRPDRELQGLLRSYLGEETSLAKMAETLGLSRFELMERFERLGVPLHLGPADLRAARDEVRVARESA
jgi:prevent-host-death family protein